MRHVSSLLLKLLMILLFVGWIALWVLKPTEFWTKKWKKAEDMASSSAFGYNGLDFVVYTFPMIGLAIISYIYMDYKQERSNNRPTRHKSFGAYLSHPVLVNSYIGILSGLQILVLLLFIALLVWTFYVRISNDFKKIIPIKSLKLSSWQYKISRMATRCGLLSEACLALLFFPVLRGMSLFRAIGIQFEASVRYHIWIGNALVFFITLHGGGTLFIWGIKHRIQDEIWKWPKKGRIYLAGEMGLITALIIWFTALPQVRRKWFHLFYYTHHLYVVFILLFLFHGGDRHFYMVFPGVFLFAIDKLLRVIQSRQETCILLARVFPCNVVELTLPKDPRMKYTPTSIIFLKIPSISKYQWHPFSITSCSSLDQNTLSVLIKCEGQWTNSLYSLIRGDHDSKGDQRKCVPIAIEGPYGPISLDFERYDNLLLVAGGIGVTPFLSIIKKISSNLSNNLNTDPSRIYLIYTMKKSQDVCLLDPIIHYLVNTEQFHIKLKVFVTRENFVGTTLKDVFSNILEPQITTFSTICTEFSLYGPERLVRIATITLASSIVFVFSLVCFNYFVIPPTKAKKYSSSLIDFFLICSFVMALICTVLIHTLMRWKRLRKGIRLSSNKKEKVVKWSSLEVSHDFDKHEICFGQRPNFQEILSTVTGECEGSNIGVLVCGPESMKESVASACKFVTTLQRVDNVQRTNFYFHSLNFTF